MIHLQLDPMQKYYQERGIRAQVRVFHKERQAKLTEELAKLFAQGRQNHTPTT